MMHDTSSLWRQHVLPFTLLLGLLAAPPLPATTCCTA